MNIKSISNNIFLSQTILNNEVEVAYQCQLQISPIMLGDEVEVKSRYQLEIHWTLHLKQCLGKQCLGMRLK